jgi:hypothetical protein
MREFLSFECDSGRKRISVKYSRFVIVVMRSLGRRRGGRLFGRYSDQALVAGYSHPALHSPALINGLDQGGSYSVRIAFSFPATGLDLHPFGEKRRRAAGRPESGSSVALVDGSTLLRLRPDDNRLRRQRRSR